MRKSRCPTFAALTLLLAGGCRSILSGTADCPKDPAPDPHKVEVRYLGSGGIYLRWHDDAILLGPSFSNPNPIRAQLLRVKPNEQRIETALQGFQYQHVRAIFAGHSHYDHIADIPAIEKKYLPGVRIYVNEIGKRLLNGEGLDVHALVVGETVDVGSSIRVRPVASGHAPQICEWRRFPCIYAGGPGPETGWTTPLTKRRLAAMNGGQTLAFVIELLDGGKVPYRIYYNDASPDTPLGQTVDDFDLAILTIAQWTWARDYPRDLLSVLRPRHVLISHWDNFFTEATRQSKGVPLLTKESVGRFGDIVDQYAKATDAGPIQPVCGLTREKWTVPAPASTMLFNPNPR